MYFINLDKLKIEKDYKFQTFTIELENINIEDSVWINKQKIKEECNKLLLNKPAIAVNYNFTIDKDINEESFIGLTNLIVSCFFECIITANGRHRERRLDVPEKLQCAHASQGLLKRAVNFQTTIDNFNLTIDCGDFHYILISDKGE